MSSIAVMWRCKADILDIEFIVEEGTKVVHERFSHRGYVTVSSLCVGMTCEFSLSNAFAPRTPLAISPVYLFFLILGKEICPEDFNNLKIIISIIIIIKVSISTTFKVWRNLLRSRREYQLTPWWLRSCGAICVQQRLKKHVPYIHVQRVNK